MELTHTLNAVVSSVWGDVIESDGFPPETRLMGPGDFYCAHSRQMRVGLATYRRDGSVMFSFSEIDPPIATASDYAIVKQMVRALALLRQRHWLALAYERGGYY